MLQKSENSTDFTPLQKEPPKEPKNHKTGSFHYFKLKIARLSLNQLEGNPSWL
jgi:hypothetical protein